MSTFEPRTLEEAVVVITAKSEEILTLLGGLLTSADQAFVDDDPDRARAIVWYMRRILDPKAAALAEANDPVFAATVKRFDEEIAKRRAPQKPTSMETAR